MDSVVVEQSTGLVGVSTLIKAALPDLHAGSVLRSVHNVLKKPDAQGLDLTTKTVNGRMMRMASLDVCNFLLDNMPGHRWVVWRTANGESFKESLTQYIEQVRSSSTEEVSRDVQVEVQEEEVQETKASTLRKALRTLNIDGSVRVDEASGKASDLDVIRLMCPGLSTHDASQMLVRLLEREDATQLEGSPRDEDNSDSIRDRISYIKINGKGRSTPVSDVKTIIEIMWQIPGAGRSFRRESAGVICRVLGGDVSLCDEIEARCEILQETPEGRSYQNFMAGGVDEEPTAKRTRIGPPIMELASPEQYAMYVRIGLDNEMTEYKHEAVKKEVSLVMSLKNAFEEITPLQERHKIELCDRLSDIQKRAFRVEEAPAITNSPMHVDAVVMAVPQQQDPGHDLPTPQCSNEVRGVEISIPMIASEMGVSVRGRGGQVGKKLKALYAERYGSNAANEIPKRHTIYGGKPYMENTFWLRDKDLVESAITMVVT